ncbi:unnamed protein product [Closterium sp. Naga37s-1]|nr:unnamed protein product [Closterium sp. Naga37s-1]
MVGDTSMEAAIADLEVCHASLKHQMTKIQLVKEQLREKWKQSNEGGQCWAGNSPLTKKSGEVFDAMITDRPVIDNKGNVSMIVGVPSDSQPFKEQVRAFIGSCSSSMHVNTSVGPVSAASPAAAAAAAAAAASVRPAASFGTAASTPDSIPSPSTPLQSIPSPTAAEDKAERQQAAAGLKPLRWSSPDRSSSFSASQSQSGVVSASASPTNLLQLNLLSHLDGSSEGDAHSHSPLRRFPSGIHGLESEDQAIYCFLGDGTITMWNAGSEKLFGYTEEEAMGRNIVELLCCKKTSHAAFQIIARLQVGQCWTGNFPLTKKSGEVFDAMITDRPIIDSKGNVSMIVGVASDSRPFKEQIQAFIGSCSSSMHVSTSLGPVSTASPGAAAAAAAFHSVASALPGAAAASPVGAAASFGAVASTPDGFPSPSRPLQSIPSPTAAEDKAEDRAKHLQVAGSLKPLQLNVTTAPLRPIRVPENAIVFATANATGGAPSRVARVASRLSAAPLRSPSQSRTAALHVPALDRTAPPQLPLLTRADEADQTVPLADLVARGSEPLNFQGGLGDGGDAVAMAFDFSKGEAAVPFDLSAEGGAGEGEVGVPFEFDVEGESAHAECQHPWQIPFASTVLSLAGRVAQSIGQVRKRLSPTSSTVVSQAHLHLPESMSPQQHLPLPPSPPAAASVTHISSSEARLHGGVQGMVIQGGRSPKASRLSPEGDRLSRHNSGSGSSCSTLSTAAAPAAAAAAAACGAAAGAAAGIWNGGGSDSADISRGFKIPAARPRLELETHVTQFAPLQPETSPAAADAAPAASPWHGFGFNSGIAGDAGPDSGVGVGAIVPSGARASAALAAAAAATACHAHMEDLILADTPKDQGGMAGMGGAGGAGIVGDMGDIAMGFVNGTDRWGGNMKFLERQQGVGAVLCAPILSVTSLSPMHATVTSSLTASSSLLAMYAPVMMFVCLFVSYLCITAGACGTVYHGTWNGSDVAVKVFARHDISADFMHDFKKEIRIMEKLRHPNILLFMAAVASLDHLAIVTEFLPRGSLFRLLHRRTAGLTRLRLLRMALDVARGVIYLHKCSPPVVHHDLKSANLLVDKNWTVKVGDFGLSKMKFATYLSARSGRGTPQWMAPEVLRNEPSNEKSDVYSFGVVLWEMATRQVPWEGMNPMQVVGAVGFLEQQLPLPPSINPAMRLLISDCWRSPNERPSFDEITSRLKMMVQEQEQQQMDGRRV